MEVLALTCLPALVHAQAVGSEFQVNTYTTGLQFLPSAASDASGNFVVVWESSGQDGSGYGIFGQRYARDGQAEGDEFQVNSYTSSFQSFPAVASDPSGNFVVVWDSFHDGSIDGIFGQRYDSEGAALGMEFRVNSYTTGTQNSAAVALDGTGNFVVVWSGRGQGDNNGIFGRRYDSTGAPRGSEFRVNSFTTGNQGLATLASDPDGDFVVVWSGRGVGDVYGVFGQRYDANGTAQGTEFRVNSHTASYQQLPSISSDASGNFVVVWESYLQDGDSFGVFGQRYDSHGVAQGAEFRVNTFTLYNQDEASISSDASGNFVVAWTTFGQDGSSLGVFAQRFDSGGQRLGTEFLVNSYTSGSQSLSSVASDATGKLVVAWVSEDQDGSDRGIFGQRFDFGADTIKVESPNTNVRWRIGSVHSIQWTHNLGASETFRIELDRNDDGNYEELIAAAAPAGATRGSFDWTVTGPASGMARVRISWTDNLAVSDTSDVTFQIRPASINE